MLSNVDLITCSLPNDIDNYAKLKKIHIERVIVQPLQIMTKLLANNWIIFSRRNIDH